MILDADIISCEVVYVLYVYVNVTEGRQAQTLRLRHASSRASAKSLAESSTDKGIKGLVDVTVPKENRVRENGLSSSMANGV